jgi:hypothetical protein
LKSKQANKDADLESPLDPSAFRVLVNEDLLYEVDVEKKEISPGLAKA